MQGSRLKLKNTIKYPTSIIINGANPLGLEIAESLLEQGGYVIVVDTYTDANVERIISKLGENALISLLDYSTVPHLEEDLRRLDYVFYLAHEFGDYGAEISTQNFLKYTNYLDSTLALAVKFEAKFLLTTAIKANQLLMSSMDIDINFGRNVSEKHTVYTEMEVQRYAESLTLEYVSKVGLNARIVRLGEIIGEGLDLAKQTPFTELLLEAVSGQDLELRNDGLESEWFVHLLDAAYGVVKAQFTKDTVGEIYSLAYESTYTFLSLAYLLQELEPEAQEIKFKADDGLPPLKLYKPAPNLAKIGWRPKVEFEQAVKESLTVAKLYLLETQSLVQNAKKTEGGVLDKLKSFLTIAKESEEARTVLEPDAGPVSRLIAERKRQQEARELALQRADRGLKSKSKRVRTPRERFQDWIWRMFFDLRGRFGFLKNVTPVQFFLYVILFLALGVFYLTVLSPFLVLGRNVITVVASLEAFQRSMTNMNFANAHEEIGQVKAAFAESASLLAKYNSVADVLALRDYLNTIVSVLDDYSLWAEGAEDITYAAAPFGEYLSRYTDNVSFRPNTDSYLSAGTSLDYSSILIEMTDRKAYAEIGKEKLNTAKLQLTSQNVAALPEVLRTWIISTTNSVARSDQLEPLADLTLLGGEILGLDDARTFLLVLLDNSRPQPIGGEIAGFLQLTFQNGAVVETKVLSVDSFTPDMAETPAYIINDINLHTFRTVAAENIKVRDLAKLSSVDLFSQIISNTWEQSFSRRVDDVLICDFEFLSELVDHVGGVSIEGEPLVGTDLLNELKLRQSENETAARRNDLATQVLAQVTDLLFDNMRTNLGPVVALATEALEGKHLVISSSELGVNNIVEAEGYAGDTIASTDMPIYLFVNSEEKVISPTKYPALNVVTKITVHDDSSLTYSLVARFPSIGNADEISICVPLFVKEIGISGVSADRVKKVKNNNTQCATIDVITETELTASWETIPFESSESTEYNLSLGLAKSVGMGMISDVEVSLASTLSFSKVTPNIAPVGNKVVFTESLETDQLIELEIKK